MKTICALIGLAAIGGLLSVPANAGDAKAGRQKVTVCQACHGLDGLSKNPEAPNLAGQVEGYLVKALNDYRSGARKNDSMSIVAKDLTDEDVANVAAYYAGIEVEVVPP